MQKSVMVIGLFMLAQMVFAGGDLAFGPDHLHLSYQEGNYRVESSFVDNTRHQKKIRYVNVRVDEALIDATEELFYDPPYRLFQSHCEPGTAIAINDGNRQMPSHVVLIRKGRMIRTIEIPLGQGPGEMTQVGNAMLIRKNTLIVYGMRKLVAFDLSEKKAVPIASTVLKMSSAGSRARMGQYRDGFVLMNDTLAKSSVGKTYYFSIYTLNEDGFLFMRQGNPDYPQDHKLLKRPMMEYEAFMKGDKNMFPAATLSSCIADGFGEFDVYLLDFLNHALLVLSTKENRIVRYTTFDQDAFARSWFEGQNFTCIPRFNELKTNFFDHTVWLLNHAKMDDNRKQLPIVADGRILSENLQEIDILDTNLNYLETLRLVPPAGYTQFNITTLAVTDRNELIAVVRLKNTGEGTRKKRNGRYLTRILLGPKSGGDE